VSISLDDFGTGYSSLSYLGTFPLDQLKLDRALVTGTAETATGAAVLAGIIRITQNLGLPVVAEGLENLADVKRLRGLGATLGQGWHYARAMAPQDALDWALARVTDGQRTEPSVTWSSERPS
jgi:sensor c-di-GMP phosphodiesterase-like protein